MTVTELHEARAAAAAPAGDRAKHVYVRRMFTAIAPRYDLLNHLLSFNIDRRWRRRAVAALDIPRHPNGRYLDLCAGTLDVSVAIARTERFAGSVVGADFAEQMLREAGAKRQAANVHAVAADALVLPIADVSCAGAIVAFGIRNVTDIDAALRETHRVLEPGARFVILEFSTPPNRLVRGAYQAYSRYVLPRIGALISGHKGAYTYLPDSVTRFPAPAALAARMSSAGFRHVHWELMTMGVVALYVGERG